MASEVILITTVQFSLLLLSVSRPSPEPADPEGLHRHAGTAGEHNRRLLEDGVAAENSPYRYAHQDL